jgi:hypothetical protein
MSARERLRQEYQRTNWVMRVSFIATVVFIFCSKQFPTGIWQVLMIFSFIIFGISAFHAYTAALPCPFCGKSLYNVIVRSGIFAIDQIKACPFCAEKLDEESPSTDQYGAKPPA